MRSPLLHDPPRKDSVRECIGYGTDHASVTTELVLIRSDNAQKSIRVVVGCKDVTEEVG